LKYYIRRKPLVDGIIVLLIFGSISPVIGQFTNQKNQVFLENEPDLDEFFIFNNLFDRIFTYLMNYGHFPSLSSCIIINDEVVWNESYGFYDLENHKAASTNTIYMVASISKTITGTALMQLYDQGLYELDDDVNNFLPFSLRNPNHPNASITFRMILSHTSSLAADSSLSHYWWANWSGDPPISWYPYPWLEEYLTPDGEFYNSVIWSESIPGEEFIYANINFDIIAYLVEIISGQPFHEYCQEYIFIPLEMLNTSYSLLDLNIDNVAIPYHYQKSGTFTRYDHHRILHYPVAGLRTSISDLSHFLIAHINGGVYQNMQILNKETVDMMHTIEASLDSYFNYGLAWTIWKQWGKATLSGHTGDFTPGFSARMIIRIRDNCAIIFFVNGDRMLNNQEDGNKAITWIQNFLFFKASLHKILPRHHLLT
jgi:CubicO group peptidase (beta-lactamase class C family)